MTARKPRRADIDPDRIGDLLAQLSTTRGWSTGLAIARLRDAWGEVVGPVLVSRCEPGWIDEHGTLTIRCDHGATANEVTMLAATILGKAQEYAAGLRLTGVTSSVRRPREPGATRAPRQP